RARQLQQRSAGVDLPHPRRLILAARREPIALVAEGKRKDAALVTGKLAQRPPALTIPEQDAVVPAARSQELSVRAEGEAEHRVVVPDQGAKLGERPLMAGGADTP